MIRDCKKIPVRSEKPAYQRTNPAALNKLHKTGEQKLVGVPIAWPLVLW